MWEAIAAASASLVTALVMWARNRRHDNADVAREMAEASQVVIGYMREEIERGYEQMESHWSDLQKCRVLCRMYESQLRQKQVDLADELMDDEENVS